MPSSFCMLFTRMSADADGIDARDQARQTCRRSYGPLPAEPSVSLLKNQSSPENQPAISTEVMVTVVKPPTIMLG